MNDFQKAQIHHWVKETLAKLNHSHLYDYIKIEFNNNFTRRMGDALWRNSQNNGVVRFSVPLWNIAGEIEQKETVVHEICHIVDAFSNKNWRISPHGLSWRILMLKCGYSGNRCHNVQRPAELKNKVQRFEAKCNCKTYSITKNRLTRIQNGTIYRCLSCKTPLTIS